MKFDQLIEQIEEIQHRLEAAGIHPSEVDVLAGIQPTYPLTSVVLGAVMGEELSEHVEGELSEETRNAVWFATEQVDSYSKHNPYAPKALWDVM